MKQIGLAAEFGDGIRQPRGARRLVTRAIRSGGGLANSKPNGNARALEREKESREITEKGSP